MFAKQIRKTMEVYVDNMLVKSLKAHDHVKDLEETFAFLRRYKMKLNPNKCTFGVESGKFLEFIVNQRGIKDNPKKIQDLLDMRSPTKANEVQSLTRRMIALSRFVSKASDRCQPFFQAIKGGADFNWIDEC